MGYSRWQLADLQVHTPADRHHRYGDVGGPQPNSDFADVLVRAHADAGVTVMAVSDHNRLDWFPILSEAGSKYGVSVFPGIEFNVNKCHMMAIWDRTERGHKLGQQFLASLFDPGVDPLTDKRDPLPTTKGSPLELAQRASQEYEALVFAPHATKDGIGLFGKGVCNTSSQVARSGYVAAFDVWGSAQSEVLRNPRSEFGDVPPAWFISGDVRSLEDVGKRAVFLKLGENPTLESLRQAFLMHHHRVAFPEHLRSTFGTITGVQYIDGAAPSWPFMRRLQISGGFHDRLDVEFGPGLNALIGGKGSGKSTIVEILRHVANAPISSQKEGGQNRKKNLPANAEAQLDVMAADGQGYTLRRPGDAQATRLLRGGEDLSIDSRRRFAIRVYGQRELAELPDDVEALRGFLAEHAGDEYGAAASEAGALAGSVRELTEKLASLESALSRTAESQERLADLTDKLKQAEAAHASEVIAASNRLSKAEQQMNLARRWPQNLTDAASDLRRIGTPPSIEHHDTIPLEIHEALEQTALVIENSAESVASGSAVLESKLTEILATHKALHQVRRHQVNSQLAQAGLSDPDELARNQGEAAKLEALVSGVPALRTQLDEALKERRDKLEKLRATRRRISRELESAAAALNERVGGRVRVRIEALADCRPLQDLLAKFLVGQSIRQDQLARLAKAGSGAIGDAIAGGMDGLEKLGVSASTAQKVLELSSEQKRELEQAETPDLVEVEVDLGASGSPSWLPLNDVSPGQRATAMLSLALATGRDALVIDQPEDDLDNQYIYEQVVGLLAKVAKSRQVIVATHNANIPILGDAELILALDASADRSRVLACGGLDDPHVAETARVILQGGDEAFRARARRYSRND